MKTLALVCALSVMAIAGCDKHRDQAKEKQPETPETTGAKVVPAASPASAVATAPTAAAAGQDEAMGCEGKEDHEGSCSGGCNQWDEAADEVAKREIPADVKWDTIPVSGMTCGGCERRIIANLGELAGVVAVEADAELGQVRVAMAQDSELRDQAVNRINSLGYKAE